MKKVILPQELQDSVEIITINSNGSSNSASRHIYLLGTAHISKKSSEQAKELVEFVRPSVVFLELCDERSAILTQNNNGKDNFDSVTPRILIEKLVNGEINAFVAAYSYILKEIGKNFDAQPGAEFIAAYEAAVTVNAEIALGDRLMTATTNRLWHGLSFYDKSRLIFHLLFGGMTGSDGNNITDEDLKKVVNNLSKNKDVLIDELKKIAIEFPWLAESLITERDLYMTINLHMLSEEVPQGDVVAVVGAGHIEGILKFWYEIPTLSSSERQRILELISVFPDKKVKGSMTTTAMRSYVKTITATKKKMGGWHGNLKNIANILSNNSSRSSQTRHYSQYYGSGIPPTAICIKNSYLQVFCHGIMFPKMRSHVNQFHSLNFKKTFPTKISMPIFLKLLRYIK